MRLLYQDVTVIDGMNNNCYTHLGEEKAMNQEG